MCQLFDSFHHHHHHLTMDGFYHKIDIYKQTKQKNTHTIRPTMNDKMYWSLSNCKKKSKENYQCGCSSSGDHLYFEIYVAFYYCKKKFLNKGMLKMSGREGKAITTTTTTTIATSTSTSNDTTTNETFLTQAISI